MGTARLLQIHGPGRYMSLTAASNGKLYAALFDASRVLEVDPFALRKAWWVLFRYAGRLLGHEPIRAAALLASLKAVAPETWIVAQCEPGVQRRVLQLL